MDREYFIWGIQEKLYKVVCIIVLRQQVSSAINKMIKEHNEYFERFDKIVMYYDNGQETLGTILDSIFLRYDGFEHGVDFDHEEKRLFQVSIC